MKHFQKTEIWSTHIALGFFGGLFLTLFIYALILIIQQHSFTFPYILELHRLNPGLFIADLFFAFGMLIGFFTGRKRMQLIHSIENLQSLEKEQNTFIQTAVENLTKGNLNARMQHEDVHPEITSSLQALQRRLKDNLESERNIRKEEQQRNWTSEGLADFGDILRTNSSDQATLAYAIISNLVRYLDINQGGFFIVKNEDTVRSLDMIACHAYDRNKFPDVRIAWGEGLIGAVAIEQKSYHTNKIPESYLTITSGLGRANPQHLLIVPLVLSEEVFGVFELASFKQFEPYQIQFVERVAENTATTLNIMRSNEQTALLLKETQEQAEKLALQEEKVRQNMEELKETQSYAAMQAEQFITFTNTVNHTLIRAEFEVDGRLIYANTLFLRKLGYSANQEVEGKPISMFIHPNDLDWFNGIWERLAQGGQHFEGLMRHTSKIGLEVWTIATYTCVRNEDGSVEKILFLAIDSSEQKQESLDLEGQLKAIDKLSPKAEFGPDGRLLNFNPLFEETLKFTSKELLNKNIFDFFAQADQERFNEIWEQAITGTAFQGQLRMIDKYEDEIWFRSTFSSVSDIYGEVDKVIFLAFDITNEKQMELSVREQHEKLKAREEEMRLQSLDLKNELKQLQSTTEIEKKNLQTDTERYLDILRNTPYPVLSVNNQRLIVVCNIAAEKLFEVKEKQVVGKMISVVLADKQVDADLQSLLTPGKSVKTLKSEEKSITLRTGKKILTPVSLFQLSSGTEYIHTLVVHSVN